MSVERKEDSIVELEEKKREVERLKAANAVLSQQVTDLQLALCDVFEIVVGGV